MPITYNTLLSDFEHRTRPHGEISTNLISALCILENASTTSEATELKLRHTTFTIYYIIYTSDITYDEIVE